MARYIDLAMVEYLIDHFGDMVTWNKKEILREIKRHAQIHATADVVPKSEVKKIFKEFERLMENNEVWFRQTDEIREEFAELKKKYTESEDTQ